MTPRKRAILVVDDEPDICWALEQILTGMGFLVASAGSAEEALRLASRFSLRLAFVDAKLPDLDGIDLARRLRATRPNLPIVLISAYYYAEDTAVRRYAEEGLIAGFISKPFSLEEIREATRLAK